MQRQTHTTTHALAWTSRYVSSARTRQLCDVNYTSEARLCTSASTVRGAIRVGCQSFAIWEPGGTILSALITFATTITPSGAVRCTQSSDAKDRAVIRLAASSA